MDIQKFKFPKLTDADIAFSTEGTNKELLAEAIKRGFDRSSNPYNKLFNTLFYSGGTLNFKRDIPEDFLNSATRYLKAFMRSWSPKHEHKEAVTSLLLSELVDL